MGDKGGSVPSSEKQWASAVSPNLRPFRKGQSGNPGGRPRGRRTLTAAAQDVLSAHPELLDGREPLESIADEVARALARRAVKGHVAAAELLGNRAEGKPGVMAHAEGLSVVGLLMSLPSRDTPLDELEGALEASTADVKARLLGEPRGGGTPPEPAAVEAEPAEAGEGPEDEPEGGEGRS